MKDHYIKLHLMVWITISLFVHLDTSRVIQVLDLARTDAGIVFQ